MFCLNYNFDGIGSSMSSWFKSLRIRCQHSDHSKSCCAFFRYTRTNDKVERERVKLQTKFEELQNAMDLVGFSEEVGVKLAGY